MRYYEGRESRGVEDLKVALDLLISANITACLVGVRALRYYGAGRVTTVGASLLIKSGPAMLTVARCQEWDVCVEDEQLSHAVAIFAGNDSYEPARPPPPVGTSFRHKQPIFKLKDAGFFLVLTPSSACFFDPRPDFCELSNKGIPYPQMPQFARSLLVLQNGSNIADLIDGMDLDEARAEGNLDLARLQEKGLEFSLKHNP